EVSGLVELPRTPVQDVVRKSQEDPVRQAFSGIGTPDDKSSFQRVDRVCSPASFHPVKWLRRLPALLSAISFARRPLFSLGHTEEVDGYVCVGLVIARTDMVDDLLDACFHKSDDMVPVTVSVPEVCRL